MEVRATGASEVTITGNIQSIEDYQEIKDVVRSIVEKGASTISIKIPDSISMPSSVIGFLLKLVHVDKIAISMFVRDDRLYNLMEILNLITILNVKRM
ncbi:MAG: hypothetical protein N2738_06765 [Thermodesulfovibrionales bacterium]|nr:hypothetical protein [Thermodesulfovibrionales bacterium]